MSKYNEKIEKAKDKLEDLKDESPKNKAKVAAVVIVCIAIIGTVFQFIAGGE